MSSGSWRRAEGHALFVDVPVQVPVDRLHVGQDVLEVPVQVHDPAEFRLLVAGAGCRPRLRARPPPSERSSPAVTGSIRTNTAPQDFGHAQGRPGRRRTRKRSRPPDRRARTAPCRPGSSPRRPGSSSRGRTARGPCGPATAGNQPTPGSGGNTPPGQAFIEVVTAKATAVLRTGNGVDVDGGLGGGRKALPPRPSCRSPLGESRYTEPATTITTAAPDWASGTGSPRAQFDPLQLELPERRLVQFLAEVGNLRGRASERPPTRSRRCAGVRERQ